MTEDNETQVFNMNSDEILEPLLIRNFEKLDDGMSADKIIELLADTIQSLQGEGVKVISLIGGAASGKSTFATALIDDLSVRHIRTDVLATDDYVKGDRKWRWEHFEGKADVDPVGKYDFGLLNSKLNDIKNNRDPNSTVGVPTYDQTTGLAVDAGEDKYDHHIGQVDVLLVEGDFHPVERPDLTIYLHVPDKQRLESRLNRDVVSRGGDLVKTTESFNFRQVTQHFPHTLAAAEAADYLVEANASQPEWTFSIYRATAN